MKIQKNCIQNNFKRTAKELQKNCKRTQEEYRISANSFRGNYYILNLTNAKVTVHTGAETIQGRKLFAEIR